MKKKETEDAKTIKETFENEIKERKEIPDEVKSKRDKTVLRNLLFAVGIVIYFILLNIGYFAIEKTIFTRDTVAFSFVILIVAIVLFERAYRTEKGYFAIHGIEVLVAAIFTYFVPYTYFNYSIKATKVIMVFPVLFAIYYCIKGIVICIKAKKERKNDIIDIVKNEDIEKDDTFLKMDKDAEIEEENKETTQEKKETKPEIAKKTTKKTTSAKTKTNKSSDKEKTKTKKVDSKVQKKTEKTKLSKADSKAKKATKTQSKTKGKTNN